MNKNIILICLEFINNLALIVETTEDTNLLTKHLKNNSKHYTKRFAGKNGNNVKL